MHLRQTSVVSPEQEAIVSSCLDCGMAVHRVLGPGYKECIYCRAFQLELDLRGIKFEAEKAVTVRYKQWELAGQRIDLIVEGRSSSRSSPWIDCSRSMFRRSFRT